MGAAQGNKETLRERILCRYNGSIQTSALKLIGSTLEKQRKANSLIKEFLAIESELIDDFSFDILSFVPCVLSYFYFLKYFYNTRLIIIINLPLTTLKPAEY
ncbi:hypothetical protein [Paenibacillus xylanexedens]|uniref:hypothetical protein n=1 Tax=Paenibacillus xylanexedens TaxID=528191 RepID=UPI0012F523CE|nr:hypothetical protein [Paenibacillus xylanexedens]